MSDMQWVTLYLAETKVLDYGLRPKQWFKT